MKKGLTGKNRKRLSLLNILCLGLGKREADVITGFSVLEELSLLESTDVCNVAETQSKLYHNGHHIFVAQVTPVGLLLTVSRHTLDMLGIFYYSHKMKYILEKCGFSTNRVRGMEKAGMVHQK